MNVLTKQELLRLIPDAMPVTRQWLIDKDKNLERHTLDNLVKSGQLVSIAHGLYMRFGSTRTWEGVVCCLQNIIKKDLPVGGLTALELRGLDHYVAILCQDFSKRAQKTRMFGRLQDRHQSALI